MNPPKRITDKSFVYRNAANTDVRATWKRYLAQQTRAQKAAADPPVQLAKRRVGKL